MLGRSDAILNPSGVRFGSSEIYNVLADSYFANRIADALCIGLQRSGETDERVVLFLKLIPGTDFSPSLVGEIKATIRKQLSARHVPWGIFECPDIPYTVSVYFLYSYLSNICRLMERRSKWRSKTQSMVDLSSCPTPLPTQSPLASSSSGANPTHRM